MALREPQWLANPENPEALTSSILSRAAVKLGAKPRAQRFSIDWLARALRHDELANLVVR